MLCQTGFVIITSVPTQEHTEVPRLSGCITSSSASADQCKANSLSCILLYIFLRLLTISLTEPIHIQQKTA